MLRHLAEDGTASSTTLAAALGESTGTTSYHLRVLADAGVIEEVPEQTNGREARSSRADGYYTTADLDAFMNEYIALLNKYGHTAETAPPGARLMQLRMFYIPDEPAEPEESGD
jgi:DNA-binding transcriptional ArsR family regulator